MIDQNRPLIGGRETMNENKKVTIKDVAQKAGVAISTVHFALNGKPGVSDLTRRRIQEAAEELGYHPNAVASSLKRGPRHIVLLLPSEEGTNKYYYPELWRGVRESLSRLTVNLVCTQMPYEDGTEGEVFEELRRMADAGEVDGILTVGHINREKITDEDWDSFHQAGIAVVFIHSPHPAGHCLCCVHPDYRIIGRTMAELVTGHIPSFGSILLCTGNPAWSSHSLIVEGFEEYLKNHGFSNMVYRDIGWILNDARYRRILQEVERPDVAACCSVYSQGTIMLARALEESGKASRIFAVGSDLQEETTAWIRKGVLNNTIQKNPYAQGYVGIRILADYLVNGIVPEENEVRVGSEVVFESNLPMYEHGRYRYLI